MLDVLGDADEIGAKNAENMDAVFSNPDKAKNLKTVIGAAKEAFTSDRRADGELSEDGKDTMTAMFRSAKNADEVADVVEKAELAKKEAEAAAAQSAAAAAAKKAEDEAAAAAKESERKAAVEEAQRLADAYISASDEEKEELKAQLDAANQAQAAAEASATAANAKKAATDSYSALLVSIQNADTADAVDVLVDTFVSQHDSLSRQGLDLNSVANDRKSSLQKGSNKVLGVLKVVKSVDKAEQDQKAAEEVALKVAEEAAAKKAAEEAAAKAAAAELAVAEASGNAEAIEAARILSETAEKKKVAVNDYSEKLEAVKSATDTSTLDSLLTDFTNAHDADIITLIQSEGFDLISSADARRAAIKAEASAAQKDNVFNNLDDVSELAVASIEVEQQAAAEAGVAAAKKAAADDYQEKLSQIELAESDADVDAILESFTSAHSAEYRDGLDLTALANAQKDIINSDESEQEAKRAQAAATKADAEARALAKVKAAEKDQAEAEAKASDTGFDNMIENADQAENLRKIVEKNAEIEENAAAKLDAAADYQLKLSEIAVAKSAEDVEALVNSFLDDNLEKYRVNLDLTAVAESRKSVLSATDEISRIAAEEAAALAASNAESAARTASAEADTAASNKADLGSLLKNADKADDLAGVLDAAESLDSSGDTSTLTALLKNPQGASDLKKIVDESRITEGKKVAAADYQLKMDAIAQAEKVEVVDLILAEFKSNNLEEYRQDLDLSTLAESRKSVLSATSDAARETAEKAADEAAAAAAESVAKSAAENSGKDSSALMTMFTVVKSSDDKKVAAQKSLDDAAAGGAFVPFEIEELITGSVDKSVLKQWRSTGVVNGQDFNNDSASLNLLNTIIDNRVEEINAKNVLAKIDTVVDVATSVQENGGGSNLDSILDNADKADDLKVLVDQAVSSGGTDGAAGLLTNVLDNAEKAKELSEVVTSAADEGVDVTKLLENAQEADSLLKAKKAADEVAIQAEEQKRAEIAASGQNLSEEEIAAQIAAAKSSAKKEVMESVAANAENAESVATVLDAAAGADADTKAALLRNADEAVAMAQTINEEIAIKAEAAEVAAADAAAAAEAEALLEEQKAGASAAELAAIQAEIDAVRLAAEQKKAAEDKFSSDLLKATSLGQVETALSEYKLVLGEGEAVPTSIANLAASRKKNLSLINVVKQVDGNKQEAKAIATRAESASVSTAFREAAQTKTSISELEQLLNDNLPTAINDIALKSKIFKAKTDDKIRELLSDFDSQTVNSAIDHWMVVFPKKEEMNAVLAFQSIGSLADVASKTAVVAEEIIHDDALSQDAKDSIDAARDALEIAESIEGIDEILTGLADLSIEIPAGLSSYADSLKKSINTLNAVLENAEQADQVAVMIGGDDGEGDNSFLDSFSTGGDDFDFDGVMATGALGTLKSARFTSDEQLPLSFDTYYRVDETTQSSVVSDYTNLSQVNEANFLKSPETLTDQLGGKVYNLSADQVKQLTGSENGVAGIYSFSEIIDADTAESTGLVISSATEKLGVRDNADPSKFTSFSVDPNRASDVLFILDSPALKVLDTDTDQIKAKKAQLKDEFISNFDQIDNILELNKVIGDEIDKIQTAFSNLSALSDLVVVSDRLRFDQDKLNQVFTLLDDTQIDSQSKAEDLSYLRSLTEKFHTSPQKLDVVFANPEKIDVIDELTNRLDVDLSGAAQEKGQINFLFSNLDYTDEFLDIVNRFEGAKRDGVLADIKSLAGSNPARKDIIFSNPSQAGAIRELYNEFKFEPSRVDVIFEFADKADAFLDVLRDLRDSGTPIQALFNDPVATMADTGFTKLINQYPEQYHQIFEENKEIAAEIAATASKFKEDPEKLDLVFTNLDKLQEINSFVNDFEEVVIDEDGNEELIRDEVRVDLFFSLLGELDALKEFQAIALEQGVSSLESLDLYSLDPSFLVVAKEYTEFLGILKKATGFLVVKEEDFTKPVVSTELFTQLADSGIGVKAIKALYENNYFSVLESQENLLNASYITKVASNFVGDVEQLGSVMSNLDKLDQIDSFFQEFGATSTEDEEGNQVIIRDNARISIFFSELSDFENFDKFRFLADEYGMPSGDALDFYSLEKEYILHFIDAFESEGSGQGENPGTTFDFPRIAALFKHAGRIGKLKTYTGFAEQNDVSPELAIDTFDKEYLYLNKTLSRFINQPKFDEQGEPVAGEDGKPFLVTDEARISILFSQLEEIDNLKSFTQLTDQTIIPFGFAFDLYAKDSGYLEVANTDKQFFVDLYEGPVSLLEIPSFLALELQKISLTKSELYEVISDLTFGPSGDGPDSSAPDDDSTRQDADLQTLSFLLDHKFEGSISSDLVVSADVARASSFFEESLDLIDSLSLLGENYDDDLPQNDSVIISPGADGVFDPNIDSHLDGIVTFDPTSQTPLSTTLSNDSEGVLAGRNLTFGSGSYDLSTLSYERLLFVARDNLSFSGELVFSVGQSSNVETELLLLSAGGISFAPETSITYQGNSLGLGSFDTVEVVDVDLYAADEISVRSLDRVVFNNVSLKTSGSGVHDAIELLAHREIAVDNLIFNENIKRIAMEAQTVNLSNLNFPNGSEVKLNSAHGAIDGKYPNFNNIMWGRVNFINNVRYSDNLIMNKTAFDTHAGNISIGKIGN